MTRNGAGPAPGDTASEESRVTHPPDPERSERLAAVLHDILRAAVETTDVSTLIARIQVVLDRLMDTTNLYVGLWEPDSQAYRFPFYADQYDTANPEIPEKLPRSLTDFVRRSGKPALVDQKLHATLIDRGEVELIGSPSHQWMGAPLTTRAGTIGVIAVQTYEEAIVYTSDDLELLDTVAGTIAVAVERTRTEEELRKSRENLAVIFDTVGDALFQLQVESGNSYRFSLVNQRFLEVTGLREDQVVGRLAEDVIPEPARELVFGMYAQAIRERSTVRWEETSTYPVGTLTWIVTVTPSFDENGTCIHLIGSVHDVTASRKVEEDLLWKGRAFEEGLTANSTADTNGNLNFVNRAFLRIWGYDHEDEVIGRPISDFLNSQAEAARILAGLNANGEWQGEFAGRRKDATTFFAQFAATVIRDDRGDIIGYQSAVLDITDRRLAEEGLANRRAHLEEEIQRRTADLRRAVDLMAGREVRMAELKGENRVLRERLARLEERTGKQPTAAGETENAS